MTVSESYAVVPPAGGARSPWAPPGRRGRGARRRAPSSASAPSGEIDTLWSSPDDVPHSAAGPARGVLVGTGNKGKVYRVGDDGRWALVATLPAGAGHGPRAHGPGRRRRS